MMKIVNGDNFCKDAKYKLYRSVYEVLHPTISKRNISNYKVVLDEKLLPVQVFYPRRVTNMKNVIIAIPGDGNVSGCYGKYASIYKNMAVEVDTLIVAIDYFGKSVKYPTSLNKIVKVVNYLYEELIKHGILKENIIFMSDSAGCCIMSELLLKLRDKKIEMVNKCIWFYPVCRNDYFEYVWDKTYLNMNLNLDKRINVYLNRYFSKNKERGKELLTFKSEDFSNRNMVIFGEMDVLKEDSQALAKQMNAEVLSLEFLTHGFLENQNCDELKKVYAKVQDFVKL